MMQYNKPYSFEKTDVRGRFLLKFSTTNVKLETVCPIAANLSLGAIVPPTKSMTINGYNG